MGFGKSSGNWNVKYKTRLGAEYVWNDVGYYKPSQFKADVVGGDVEPGVLSDEKGYDIDSWLDLSETEKMDFGIYVIKYPSSPGTVYSGHMTIEAEDVDFASCGQSPMPI